MTTVEAHSCLLNMHVTFDLTEIEELMPQQARKQAHRQNSLKGGSKFWSLDVQLGLTHSSCVVHVCTFCVVFCGLRFSHILIAVLRMHASSPHSAHGVAQARATVSCIHVVFHSIPRFINWCSLVSASCSVLLHI